MAKFTLSTNSYITPLGDKKPTSNLFAKVTVGEMNIKNKIKIILKVCLHGF
jgi:hypothetical protein